MDMHTILIISLLYTQFTSMEGNRRRKNQFKKGCTPWNKRISLQVDGPSPAPQSVKLGPTFRIYMDEFSLVTKTSSSTAPFPRQIVKVYLILSDCFGGMHKTLKRTTTPVD